MSKKSEEKTSDSSTVVVNRKARFNYTILETFEAGIVLSGNEIKSIRDGGVLLAEAYIKPQNGEMLLIGSHIKEYAFSHDPKYNPDRVRKLLLHKREIERLQGKVETKGLTLVPLRLYLKNGLAKVEIALAKGKDAPDKRRTIMAREKDREAERAMKRMK